MGGGEGGGLGSVEMRSSVMENGANLNETFAPRDTSRVEGAFDRSSAKLRRERGVYVCVCVCACVPRMHTYWVFDRSAGFLPQIGGRGRT